MENIILTAFHKATQYRHLSYIVLSILWVTCFAYRPSYTDFNPVVTSQFISLNTEIANILKVVNNSWQLLSVTDSDCRGAQELYLAFKASRCCGYSITSSKSTPRDLFCFPSGWNRTSCLWRHKICLPPPPFASLTYHFRPAYPPSRPYKIDILSISTVVRNRIPLL